MFSQTFAELRRWWGGLLCQCYDWILRSTCNSPSSKTGMSSPFCTTTLHFLPLETIVTTQLPFSSTFSKMILNNFLPPLTLFDTHFTQLPEALKAIPWDDTQFPIQKNSMAENHTVFFLHPILFYCLCITKSWKIIIESGVICCHARSRFILPQFSDIRNIRSKHRSTQQWLLLVLSLDGRAASFSLLLFSLFPVIFIRICICQAHNCYSFCTQLVYMISHSPDKYKFGIRISHFPHKTALSYTAMIIPPSFAYMLLTPLV